VAGEVLRRLRGTSGRPGDVREERKLFSVAFADLSWVDGPRGAGYAEEVHELGEVLDRSLPEPTSYNSAIAGTLSMGAAGFEPATSRV